ncbi:MAG: restriction endonuclease subunit S, partial [Enterococcus sp.]|nr:restriction endonuclease subunit S [Enterococcus sp.]
MAKKTPEIRFEGFDDDWEQRKVRDYAQETYGGGTPKTTIEEYWTGDIDWIQSSDLTEHQVFDVVAKKHISKVGVNNS